MNMMMTLVMTLMMITCTEHVRDCDGDFDEYADDYDDVADDYGDVDDDHDDVGTCTEHAREDGGKPKQGFLAHLVRYYWNLCCYDD